MTALDRKQSEAALRRIFNGGVMRRLPKSKKDTEMLLALAASALDPQAIYSEAEVNSALADWMAGFTDPVTLDHVTIRRYLVDRALLLRDTPGSVYRTNQAVINRVIEPEVREIQPELILQEVRKDRAGRKRKASAS
ncbi:MAG: DUF2087 domain-containing protein [Gammaproteobacteria bacterium]|jgi:hypothetical protein|nr:DUF2087 domain-containing protein [Gammaproteobacteria bacterium]MBT7370862.1 DUF2087 domain-containing protein [Gammaproteobacteria bacterium]